jgi:glyoxylase-like metal-dependent hydrolase (beta-lactamase superfamily II)
MDFIWNKIKGNTYYIQAPTNIGVYVFKNKNCLLVDTGYNNSQSRKVEEILLNEGLHPKYIINTHSHLDHCGANAYLTSTYPGCQVFASQKEKMYMEDPSLQPTVLFGAKPLHDFIKAKPIPVDFIVEEGFQKINDEKFFIHDLQGHAVGQIGITTPEKITFLGDAVFSREIIDKYTLPYLFDIECSLKTLHTLKEMDSECFVLSHSTCIYDAQEFKELVDFNLQHIEILADEILSFLAQPLSREDLLENVSTYHDLEMEFKQYHLNLSVISAFIKYLLEQGHISYSIENGKLYYFKK